MNYSLETEKVIKDTNTRGSTLLLHSCCAPCSSYVLFYLKSIFKITVFYYNPNITQKEEYQKRVEEQKRLIAEINKDWKSPDDGFLISVIEGDYEPMCFFEAVKGLEKEKEGGKRCEACFRLRLQKTAELAERGHFDFFTTTLTISPLKNAELLNRIGSEIASDLNTKYLLSDFKKKDGYKQSIELSREYSLYRQDYCGCIFSKTERELSKEQNGG